MGLAGQRRNSSLPPRATLWILGMLTLGLCAVGIACFVVVTFSDFNRRLTYVHAHLSRPSKGTIMLLLGFGQYYEEWFGESDTENTAGECIYMCML